jgi:hypothetical protein
MAATDSAATAATRCPTFTLAAKYSLAPDAPLGDIALDLATCLEGALAVLNRLQDEGDFISAEAFGVHTLLSIADGLGGV